MAGKRGRKKRKEAGKIVVKKHARARISLPRIRWDIVIVVVIVGLIATATFLAYTSSRGGNTEKLSYSDLLKYLGDVASGKNEKLALDLFYNVRGDIVTSSGILGIKDTLQVDIRFSKVTLPAPKNSSKSKQIVIKGYLVFYYGLEYLNELYNLLGMSNNLKNLSQVLVNIDKLNRSVKNLKVVDAGSERIKLGRIGYVDTYKQIITYKAKIGSKYYPVELKVWRERNYGVPVKVCIRISEYELNITLNSYRPRVIGAGIK